MRKEVILITGAAGEMGEALIARLAEGGADNILALDVKPLPDDLRRRCHRVILGDILDEALFGRLIAEYAIPLIYHLAALLSTRAEYTPEAAHRVNVGGTLNLLKLAADQSTWLGAPVRFMFPSSVAVYGLPDLATKAREDLEQIYGERLRGVYLYGSAARDQLTPDSDVDIAVVLDEIQSRFEEHETASQKRFAAN